MPHLDPPSIRQTLLIFTLASALFMTGCDSNSTDSATATTDTIETGADTEATDTGGEAETNEDAASTDTTDETVADADFEATDWTEETHSKSIDPNYYEVFDDTQVKRLDFVVTDERWQSMLDDMMATYGEFGANTAGAAPAVGAGPGVVVGPGPDDGIGFGPGAPPIDGGAAGPGGLVGGPDQQNQGLIEADEDPIFVPADVYYNGKQWYRVGIRFKGNSTLQGAWQSGVLKLSFKMDFDEYEDDYPQIDNQRFYGFKKFSLKNNYLDNSQLREKVATDTFRNAGLASSHAAFYTLYVDHGNGPEYFGLYTLVEEVDGEVLDTQFTSDDGNLYKPEDGSANFVQGTFSTEDFEKKTNEDDADWSDVSAMFDALHDETATTDPAAWRAGLEATFDVDNFLKYLAVNGIIQNWDTYGRMPHNYYLYNNPDNGLLTWIPWDNNESLQEGKQGGALDLAFTNLSASEWPLIGNIIADNSYRARYNELLAEVMAGAFETSSTQALYDNYATLVGPYATSEIAGYTFLSNSNDFSDEIAKLKIHASARDTAVSTYLSTQ